MLPTDLWERQRIRRRWFDAQNPRLDPGFAHSLLQPEHGNRSTTYSGIRSMDLQNIHVGSSGRSFCWPKYYSRLVKDTSISWAILR
jgi:hypothetical protein